MDERRARANVARFLGNTALGGAVVVVALGAFYWDYLRACVLALLLVITGVGLRLEGAIKDRP